MEVNYCSHCGTELGVSKDRCPNCGAPMKKKGMPTWLIVLIVVGVLFVLVLPVIGILAAILVPNFLRARGQGQFTQCQSNCKNIGTALEMYSTDNKGEYPDDLEYLVPDYLRAIPTCASFGDDTYSKSYESKASDETESIKNSSAYTFYCSGQNHKAVGVTGNYPQYNSREGLVPRGRYRQ
ncbi:MAG: hypothetical protein K8T10_20345 [Candidatus Eremiobacteraeota bacterium]|nr:hypothetical protein [Candidatus Eremiobacteraeota bacterium]